jgi:hypothetical protein
MQFWFCLEFKNADHSLLNWLCQFYFIYLQNNARTHLQKKKKIERKITERHPVSKTQWNFVLTDNRNCLTLISQTRVNKMQPSFSPEIGKSLTVFGRVSQHLRTAQKIVDSFRRELVDINTGILNSQYRRVMEHKKWTLCRKQVSWYC